MSGEARAVAQPMEVKRPEGGGNFLKPGAFKRVVGCLPTRHPQVSTGGMPEQSEQQAKTRQSGILHSVR